MIKLQFSAKLILFKIQLTTIDKKNMDFIFLINSTTQLS